MKNTFQTVLLDSGQQEEGAHERVLAAERMLRLTGMLIKGQTLKSLTGVITVNAAQLLDTYQIVQSPFASAVIRTIPVFSKTPTPVMLPGLLH